MKVYIHIRDRINRMRDEDGATAVEYGLIISFIALFIVGAVGAVGIALDGFFNDLATRF